MTSVENKAEIILLVSDLCPHCKSLEESLKDRIDSGEIKVLSIEKDAGAVDIAKRLGIKAVPTFLMVSEKDGKKNICKLSDDLKKVECVEETGV